jgi:antitoxin VapB
MSATNAKPEPKISPLAASTTKTAKLFKNGRSQAVRLPKEFRFEGKEVAIRRNPATGEVVLSQPPAQQTKSWQEWFDLLDSLDIPEGTFAREVHMPTERDIF